MEAADSIFAEEDFSHEFWFLLSIFLSEEDFGKFERQTLKSGGLDGPSVISSTSLGLGEARREFCDIWTFCFRLRRGLPVLAYSA